MTRHAPLLVSELCDPRVRVEWHEAVAVVLAIADLALGPDLTGMPDPEYVALTDRGELIPLASAPVSEDPVRDLGSTLSLLLGPADGPLDVRRFATISRDSESVLPRDFVATLRVFERPNGPLRLAGLARRAVELREEASADTELRRIAERTRTRTVPSEATRAANVFARFRPVTWVGIVIVVLGTVTVGIAQRWASSDAPRAVAPSAPAPASDPRPATPVEGASSGTGLDAAASAPESSSVPATAAASPGVAARVEAPHPRPRRNVPSGIAGVREPVAAPVAQMAPRNASTATRTLRVWITELPGRPLDDPIGQTVFTSRDPDVRPATFLRAYLPSQPSSAKFADELGTLDFIIDPAGHVEWVRLISPTNSYQERMLVAAAKAWKFRPATKNGLPVRYRMQVPITR